jgi:hypothetical protein
MLIALGVHHMTPAAVFQVSEVGNVDHGAQLAVPLDQDNAFLLAFWVLSLIIAGHLGH